MGELNSLTLKECRNSSSVHDINLAIAFYPGFIPHFEWQIKENALQGGPEIFPLGVIVFFPPIYKF